MTPIDRDKWIVKFLNTVGAEALSQDIGRTPRWIKARATRLRNCGAWAALERLDQAQCRHMAEYFEALGVEHFIDEDRQSKSGLKVVG